MIFMELTLTIGDLNHTNYTRVAKYCSRSPYLHLGGGTVDPASNPGDKSIRQKDGTVDWEEQPDALPSVSDLKVSIRFDKSSKGKKSLAKQLEDVNGLFKILSRTG